jgi:hypothetical protein
MADGISVRITGPDIAALALAATEKIMQDAEDSLDDIADKTQSDAKDDCPVAQNPKKGEIPGTLRDSIKVFARKFLRQIGTDVPYGPYVHNGTWKMKARPFLFNAVEKNKQAWVAAIMSRRIT